MERLLGRWLFECMKFEWKPSQEAKLSSLLCSFSTIASYVYQTRLNKEDWVNKLREKKPFLLPVVIYRHRSNENLWWWDKREEKALQILKNDNQKKQNAKHSGHSIEYSH